MTILTPCHHYTGQPALAGFPVKTLPMSTAMDMACEHGCGKMMPVFVGHENGCHFLTPMCMGHGHGP